jgi:kumamolisin
MSEAFNVTLQMYDHPNGAYRGRTGSVQIPANLKGTIQGVFGLDNRPQAKPHMRPVGYLNPWFYISITSVAGAFHDITSGNNGAYQTSPG